ncbi:MAG TPA: glutamyl-tRNA reductase [Phycisphaeraceae bacterium]
MRIVLVGINHRTAPVELRERLALAQDERPAVLDELRRRYPSAEGVLLSTCNRTELYVARPVHEPPSADELRHFLAWCGRIDPPDLLSAISIHREQEQAVHHLFRVCCGLDSLVLGEPQILGQVKRAYEQAVNQGVVGPVLHRVFQQALAAAKQVRTRTGIGAGRVSVGSVAVDFARQVFEDFTDKTVLGIGAGEMAKAAMKHLLGVSPQRLWVVSRSLDRAAALAQSLGLTAPQGGARPWEDLDQAIVEADIIITGTGSREPVLSHERLKPLQKQRRNRPLFIIDIAVPRDVDPQVGSLNNVYLYNIDDLIAVADQGLQQRRQQAQQCETYLNSAVAECMRQIQHRDIGRLVRQLRQRLHELGRLEQQRTSRKLQSLAGGPSNPAMEALLEEHTHRLINKILHLPLSQLDRAPSAAALGFHAAALRKLFALEDTPFSATANGSPADESADQTQRCDDSPSDQAAADSSASRGQTSG